MRVSDLHRLRRIVEIRSLQQSGGEASLGRARQSCDERRDQAASAGDVLARNHAAWLAKMEGTTVDLDAGAIWARAVREAGAGVVAADEALATAQSRQATARADLTKSIGRHEAARATLKHEERYARRQRDERALDIAENQARARSVRS